VDRLLISGALQGALLATLLAATPVAADAFYAVVDLRAVASDGERSFLNGGLGELRFDDQHDAGIITTSSRSFTSTPTRSPMATTTAARWTSPSSMPKCGRTRGTAGAHA
jgi:hypothetical protein